MDSLQRSHLVFSRVYRVAKVLIHVRSILGLGSTLGLGVYVVTSYAITYDAGPSYVISVIIAGVASLFAGTLRHRVVQMPFQKSNALFYNCSQ